MPDIPKHELIRFYPEFDMAKVIASLLDDLYDRAEWSVTHQDKLHAAAELTYIHHLGFAGVPPIEDILTEGVDVAVDYFLGPRRDADRREEVWYQPFRDGFMLALLAARSDELSQLCGWVQVDRVPEYCGPIEPQIPSLYVLMAGSFRKEPIEGMEQFEASIAKARTKRPRALLEAWQAARDGDQTKFDSAIKQSLKRFSSNQSPKDGYIGERIARVDTAVCLAAMRLGLKSPDLPENLAARVVTRKSLALEA